MGRQKIWLDCDPGHDDAIAILLALHLNVDLVGISTVHGNGSLIDTTHNAARLLLSFTNKDQAEKVPIYSGASKPLVRPTKYAPEIHGDDGLGGVEGLLPNTDSRVKAKYDATATHNAVKNIADCVQECQEGDEFTIVATGSLTNIASFCATFAELLPRVKQIVVMGGAEGRGNITPTAEFNIFVDPEAAKLVFDAEIKVVMIPLNVTHTALFTEELNQRLLQKTRDSPHSTLAKTQLRHTISTLLSFFAHTYETVFDFTNGPPVHDPLCIAYVTHPELFQGKRYRVDCETKGEFTAGTTIIDLWDYKTASLTDMADPESPKSWGLLGKNVWVAERVEVDAFWELFFHCVDRADDLSPLNEH